MGLVETRTESRGNVGRAALAPLSALSETATWTCVPLSYNCAHLFLPLVLLHIRTCIVTGEHG